MSYGQPNQYGQQPDQQPDQHGQPMQYGQDTYTQDSYAQQQQYGQDAYGQQYVQDPYAQQMQYGQDPYGQPIQQYGQDPYAQQMPQYPQSGYDAYGMPMIGASSPNSLATVAMVLGIVSIVLIFVMFILAFSDLDSTIVGLTALCAPLLGILATIFGFIGLSKSKTIMGSGKGKAITGLTLGILSTLIFVLVIWAGLSAMS